MMKLEPLKLFYETNCIECAVSVIKPCIGSKQSGIEYAYRYDIIRGEEIAGSINVDYNRADFLQKLRDYPDECNEVLISSVKSSLARVLQLGERQQSKIALEELISKTFEKAISK